jgi:hypothetical protein
MLVNGAALHVSRQGHKVWFCDVFIWPEGKPGSLGITGIDAHMYRLDGPANIGPRGAKIWVLTKRSVKTLRVK